MNPEGDHLTKQGMVFPLKLHSGYIGYSLSFPLFFTKITISWITNYFCIHIKSGLNLILLFYTSNNYNTKYRGATKCSESKHSEMAVIMGYYVLRNSPDLSHIFLTTNMTVTLLGDVACHLIYYLVHLWICQVVFCIQMLGLRLDAWLKH